MEAVIIVIHLMVILALIGVVLLQRSEGGALGIGGSNAFLTSRGQGNVLTRATTILGIAFFATSVALTVLTRLTAPPSAILNNVSAPAATAPVIPAVPATGLPSSNAGTLNLAPAPLVPTPGSIAPTTPPPATPPPAATPAPAAPATPAPAAPAQ